MIAHHCLSTQPAEGVAAPLERGPRSPPQPKARLPGLARQRWYARPRLASSRDVMYRRCGSLNSPSGPPKCTHRAPDSTDAAPNRRRTSASRTPEAAAAARKSAWGRFSSWTCLHPVTPLRFSRPSLPAGCGRWAAACAVHALAHTHSKPARHPPVHLLLPMAVALRSTPLTGRSGAAALISVRRPPTQAM
jgi:hypothetical protein